MTDLQTQLDELRELNERLAWRLEEKVTRIAELERQNAELREALRHVACHLKTS